MCRVEENERSYMEKLRHFGKLQKLITDYWGNEMDFTHFTSSSSNPLNFLF